jgi:hypothetical protein
MDEKIFGSWFQRFQSMVTWSHHCWPEVENSSWSRAAQLMVTWKKRQDLGTNYSSRAHPTGVLPPTRPHLLN